MALFLVAAALVGCANRIVPPAAPADPVAVYLVDYGRHSSLLLPDSEPGHFVEYAYGDWNWFALDRSESLHVFPTLLWPTRGALGRWRWSLGADMELIRHRMICEDVMEITVAGTDVLAQRRRLEERYGQASETMHHQPKYMLDFVHDEANYWVFHNCNHVVLSWLEELGCEVHGSGILAVFEVEPARTPAGDAESIGRGDAGEGRSFRRSARHRRSGVL